MYDSICPLRVEITLSELRAKSINDTLIEKLLTFSPLQYLIVSSE